MRAYADPLAQAEIDRLTAKLAVLEAGQPLVSEALRDEIQRLTGILARLEWLAEGWIRNGDGPRRTASGQLRHCGYILRDEIAPKETE